MRKTVLVSLLLLTIACATTPTTTDFDVQIRQNDQRTSDAGQKNAGHWAAFGLDVIVANRTGSPWTVEGVALQTVSKTPLEMPRWVERWDEPIAPGETKTLHRYWPARVSVGFGKRDIPIRVELYLVAADGTRRTESFVR